MTREEAIKGLKVLRRDFSGYKPNEEMFDMAIKALEQDPFINKPCVSSRVCEHDKQKVLDKIRAEIKSMSGDIETIADVLQIIDKYKTESEEA